MPRPLRIPKAGGGCFAAWRAPSRTSRAQNLFPLLFPLHTQPHPAAPSEATKQESPHRERAGPRSCVTWDEVEAFFHER